MEDYRNLLIAKKKTRPQATDLFRRTEQSKSQIVIQMPGAVSLGVGEDGGGGGVAVAILAGEQEDREGVAVEVLPEDGGDLPTD